MYASTPAHGHGGLTAGAADHVQLRRQVNTRLAAPTVSALPRRCLQSRSEQAMEQMAAARKVLFLEEGDVHTLRAQRQRAWRRARRSFARAASVRCLALRSSRTRRRRQEKDRHRMASSAARSAVAFEPLQLDSPPSGAPRAVAEGSAPPAPSVAGSGTASPRAPVPPRGARGWARLVRWALVSPFTNAATLRDAPSELWICFWLEAIIALNYFTLSLILTEYLSVEFGCGGALPAHATCLWPQRAPPRARTRARCARHHHASWGFLRSHTSQRVSASQGSLAH
jgi:hypothetical protein